MRRHRHLILNWFRAKRTISSGVVEGLNGVVKLTTRKAFGFRTAKGIEIPLFHVLGRGCRSRNQPTGSAEAAPMKALSEDHNDTNHCKHSLTSLPQATQSARPPCIIRL